MFSHQNSILIIFDIQIPTIEYEFEEKNYEFICVLEA